MSLRSTPQLEQLIRQVFKELPPIKDGELSPVGFEFPSSSATEGLDDLRGCSRYGLFERCRWVDFGVLYRMSPYAVWYFSPAFMLMALHGLQEFEFTELMQVFKFPDHVLQDAGWEAGAAARPEVFDIASYIKELDVVQCLTIPAAHDLGVEWFSRQAAFYSPIEKKVVGRFLAWLSVQWPGDEAIELAAVNFWNR